MLTCSLNWSDTSIQPPTFALAQSLFGTLDVNVIVLVVSGAGWDNQAAPVTLVGLHLRGAICFMMPCLLSTLIGSTVGVQKSLNTSTMFVQFVLVVAVEGAKTQFNKKSGF